MLIASGLQDGAAEEYAVCKWSAKICSENASSYFSFYRQNLDQRELPCRDGVSLQECSSVKVSTRKDKPKKDSSGVEDFDSESKEMGKKAEKHLPPQVAGSVVQLECTVSTSAGQYCCSCKQLSSSPPCLK